LGGIRSHNIYFLWNPLSGLAEVSRLSGVGTVGAVGAPRCKTCSVSELTNIDSPLSKCGVTIPGGGRPDKIKGWVVLIESGGSPLREYQRFRGLLRDCQDDWDYWNWRNYCGCRG